MSRIRNNFLDRLFIFKNSLANPSVRDQLLNNYEHNNVARLLRNGLAVVGFVALEDFIKYRTIEILDEISQSHIQFNNLTDDLKFYATVEVLNSIARIAKFQTDKQTKISFVQAEAKIISSSLETSYILNKHIFGFKNSNIDSEEIKRILKSFNVKNSWNAQTNLGSIIGIIGLSLENSFDIASQRRNKAAHDVSSVIPTTDLENYVTEAIAIALTFDALLTFAKNKLINDNQNFLNNGPIIDAKSIILSEITYNGSKWKYKRKQSTRATRVNSNKQLLLNEVIPIAKCNQECLIIYNENHEIENWYV